MVGDTYGTKEKTYEDDGKWQVINGVNIDAMNASQLAEAALEGHGWEVAGYWVGYGNSPGRPVPYETSTENVEERQQS